VRLLVTPEPRRQAVSDLSGSRTGGDLALAWSPVTHDTLGNPLAVDSLQEKP
jgi:hypothetical protein